MENPNTWNEFKKELSMNLDSAQEVVDLYQKYNVTLSVEEVEKALKDYESLISDRYCGSSLISYIYDLFSNRLKIVKS